MRQLFDQKENSELILDRKVRKSSFNFQKIKLRLHTLSLFWGCSFRKRNKLCELFGNSKFVKNIAPAFWPEKSTRSFSFPKFAKFVSFPDNKTPFAYPLTVLGLQFPETKRTLRTFGKLKIRKKKSRQLFDQKNQPEVLVSQKFAKFVSFPEHKTPFAYPLAVLGLQFPETKRTLRTFGNLKNSQKKSRQLFDQKNQPEVLVFQKFAKFVSFPENKTPIAYPLTVLGLQFPETKRTLRTFGKVKNSPKKIAPAFWPEKSTQSFSFPKVRESSLHSRKIKLHLHTLSVFWGCNFRKLNELCELLGN